MTAKQKAARQKFKKVVAEAGKLRKKNPKLTQAQAVKQAWAIQKKVGAIKIIEKGESKSAKPKATYQQVRTKKGTYKGLKKVGYDQEIEESNFTRITNDSNGNPRYVIHYLNVDRDYDKALKISKKIGGKKFNNKQFGGGIVFQSYNIERTAERLNEEISKNKKIGAATKVKTKKGKSTEQHTDTKSHNVNIKVVSGVNDDAFLKLKNNINNLELLEDEFNTLKKYKKDIVSRNGNTKYMDAYRYYSFMIKQTKKNISDIKKHIK